MINQNSAESHEIDIQMSLVVRKQFKLSNEYFGFLLICFVVTIIRGLTVMYFEARSDTLLTPIIGNITIGKTAVAEIGRASVIQ